MDHDTLVILAVRHAMQNRNAALFDFIRSKPKPPRRTNPITQYLEPRWVEQALAKVGLPVSVDLPTDAGSGASAGVYIRDVPGRAVNRSRQVQQALAPIVRSVGEATGYPVRALVEIDLTNPAFEPDAGLTAYRVTFEPDAALGRNAAMGRNASMKLPRDLRVKLNKALTVAGLDGNIPFRSLGQGVAQAGAILGHFGVEWDTVISLPPVPDGRRTFDLAFTNSEDLFSPVPVSDAVLAFSWHEHQNGKYEILAYVS